MQKLFKSEQKTAEEKENDTASRVEAMEASQVNRSQVDATNRSVPPTPYKATGEGSEFASNAKERTEAKSRMGE